MLATVLLVEDDAAVRKVVRHMLAGLGFAVLEAGNAPEALSVASAHSGRIDLLLTDVVLPESDGGRFVSELQDGRPDLKVIYISGYTQEVLDRRGVVGTGAEFIQKPFTAEALGRKIRKVLGDSGDDRMRSADACRGR